MIKLECKYCKKKFSVFPYRLKRKDSKVKYCSSECYHNDFIGSKMSKKTRKKMSESHEKPIWLENQTPWNKGKKGLQKAWNKGTGKNFITTDGYKKIWKNNKRYLEHRFIMEEYLVITCKFSILLSNLFSLI